MGSSANTPLEPSEPSTQIQYVPGEFEDAFDAYLSGNGSLAKVLEEWELAKQTQRDLGQWSSLMAFVRRIRQGNGRLSETELRILDVFVAMDEAYRYLAELASGGRADELEHIRRYVVARGYDDHAVFAGLAYIVFDTVDRSGHPTALGKVLLSYLPDRVDDLLQSVATKRWWWEPGYAIQAPYVALVSLLLASRPRLVDAGVRASQQAPANQIAGCVLRLLEATPEPTQGWQKVREWAREVAGPLSPATAQGRREVLAGLLHVEADRHLDLAYEALRSPDDELACVGLEGIYRSNPAQGLVAVEEAAMHGGPRLGLYALGFLKGVDFDVARPLLLRCIASAKASEARLGALELLLGYEWDGRDSYVYSLLAHRALRIRRVAIVELTRHGESAIPLIESYLRHPQARARLAAAEALLRVGGASGRALVERHLATERSDRVRLELLVALGQPLPPPKLDEEPLEAPDAVVVEAQQALKRTRWRAGKYLVPDDAGLQGTRWLKGDLMPPAAVRYLLYRQSRTKRRAGMLDVRARQIMALVEPGSAARLARIIFVNWIAQDAPVRESWCLPLVCAVADSELLQDVFKYVREFTWRLGSRSWRLRLAELMLRALALCNDEVIFSRIGDIASDLDLDRDFRHYGSVRAAACDALLDAACRLQISPEELLDRAATRPDWGPSRTFVCNYSTSTYVAQLASNLLWHFRDDAGTQLRAIPKPSSSTAAGVDHGSAVQAYEDWKALRRQVREAVRRQTGRLHTAFVEKRVWSVAAWKRIFLHHPLMRLLATNVVWAVGDPDSKTLAATFRPIDGGTLIMADGQAMMLPKEGRVGDEAVIWLVQLQHLDDALRQAWITHLTSTRRRPPFSQLGRSVTRM